MPAVFIWLNVSYEVKCPYNMPEISHLIPCRSSHSHNCRSNHSLNSTYAYPEYRTIRHKVVMFLIPLTLFYCSQNGFRWRSAYSPVHTGRSQSNVPEFHDAVL